MACEDCGGRGIGFGPAVPVAILCDDRQSDTFTSTAARPVLACFTPTDTDQAAISIMAHVVYDGTTAVSTFFTTEDASVVINPATHLGGGTVTLGQCQARTIVSEVCYLDCVSTGTRVEWDQLQTWDALNPTLASMLVDLGAGTPVAVNNVSGLGDNVTITPIGTGLDSVLYDSGGERLEIRIDQGQSGGLQFEFDAPQCAVISGGALDATDTIDYTSNANLSVGERPDLVGAIPPIVSNNNTTAVTVTGQNGLDAQLGGADGASTIAVLYTDIDAGQAPTDGWLFGIFIGGTPEYYTERFYSDGTTDITNNASGAIVASPGEWLIVPCSTVADCCPVAGDEVIVGAGYGLDLISGATGTWTPGANQIVAAISINVKVVGDTNNPPVFTDSRGIDTPIAQPMELSGAAPSDWGAPSFTNIPKISHSVGDVICVAWTYAETAII